MAGNGTDAQLTQGAPGALVDLVHRIEGAEPLDAVAGMVERVSRPLEEPGINRVLTGAWMGHALHPLMTDFPLGAWTSATLLDLFGGRRSRAAAQGLVVFGVACTAPTIASGLVEWRRTNRQDQRVGVVHAMTNGLATACFAASVIPRARGRRVRAAAWSVTGGLLATVGGYLGGHLSLARKVGSHDVHLADPRPAPHGGPGGAAEEPVFTPR
jgi:uncharacterized membrane protein